MVEAVQSWFRQNTGIVAILIGQTIALIGGIAYVVNWKADIESRVHILEERGSPHLSAITTRLTVTEKETESNKARIDRITEIMLRELPIKKEQLR
jgi:hypothetical protein